MTIEQENALLKLALCHMIDQFAYSITEDSKEYFHTLCESAGEWAFDALGFKGDIILKQEFYHFYDECEENYRKLMGYDSPIFSREKYYTDIKKE